MKIRNRSIENKLTIQQHNKYLTLKELQLIANRNSITAIEVKTV